MIAWLRGRLQVRSPDGIVVDVGGVGYLVSVSLNTFHALPRLGETVELEIHTQVREDLIALFGFVVPGEKAMFLELMEISGIGPKMALAVLSGVSPAELVSAVQSGQTNRLLKISGVGKRLAARIVLELKDRITRPGFSLDGVVMEAPRPEGDTESKGASGLEDLALALASLGYSKAEIDRAVRKVGAAEGQPLEALLRAALRELSPPVGR